MLYVIVATLNNVAYTQRLFAALSNVRREASELRLIIVDNGSTDGTREWATQMQFLKRVETKTIVHNGGVALLPNEQNLGCATAWNQGIRFAMANHADAILIAGNDTLPMPGTVERMLGLIREGVQFVTGTQVPYATPEQTVEPAPTDLALFAAPDFSFFMFTPSVVERVGNWDAALHTAVTEKIRAGEIQGEYPAAVMAPWDWGLFDSRYECGYVEDNDMHHRCRQAGVLCVRDPGAIFRHECSLTIRTNPDIGARNQRTFRQNIELFKAKWGGLPHNVDAVGARPLNVTDEQWAQMSGGREVQELPREEVIAAAKQVYGRYGVAA